MSERTDKHRPIPTGVGCGGLDDETAPGALGTVGVWPVAVDATDKYRVRLAAASVVEPSTGGIEQPAAATDDSPGAGGGERMTQYLSVGFEDAVESGDSVSVNAAGVLAPAPDNPNDPDESKFTKDLFGDPGIDITHAVEYRDPSHLLGGDVVVAARSGFHDATLTDRGVDVDIAYAQDGPDGDGVGTVTITDQWALDASLAIGDEGAPVFAGDSGRLIGLVSWAADNDYAFVSPAPRIENALQVDIYPTHEDPTASASLQLERKAERGYIAVTVSDEFERPVSGATISVTGMAELRGETNDRGRWSSNLDIGAYDVSITHPDYESWSTSIDESDFEDPI